MSLPVPSSTPPLLAGYLILFSAAALACLAGAWRARRIESRDVRRGLIGLLGTSGLWASAHVGMLLVPTLFLKAWVYDVGLIVGFGTVGAWLWFCSAYSGRALHRNRAAQGIALFVFGAVTLTKLTNPLHGLYFSAGWEALPFRHLRVDHHLLYWGTVRLSYAGAAVGFFMLYEPLRRARVGSGRLAGLFGLTALPLLANGLGYLSPSLLDVSHEPVGVAAFAIGVLFVYQDQFEATSQAGCREKPTLVLSEGGRIRNYNRAAAALFPALAEQGAVGRDLTGLLPEVAEAVGEEPAATGEAEMLQLEEEGAARYYRPTESTFGHGGGRRVVLIDVTEQTLRRRAQAREHRFLSEAVDQAKETVLVTKAEPLGEPGPRIVYANEAFEAMTGYAEDEVLGKTPRVLQGPETDRNVLDSLRAALEAKESWEGETVNYRKDGTPYTVQWSLAPVTGEDGSIQHWVSVQRDVTEQREQEERLRKQKSLLEQTQQLAGAWEIDLKAGEMSWSEEVYRIHEVEPGTDVSVEEGIEFYAPEARPKLLEAFEQCAEEGEPYDLELPIVTAEGNRRWVRTVGAPGETSDGEVTKVAGALQDITERKETEDQLQRSRERYRSLFEDSTDAILVHDLEGRIQESNPRAESLFGLEAGALEGQSVRDLYAPNEQETAKEKLAALRAGDSYQAVSRYERADGPTFWGEVSANVTEIGDETVVRTLIRDVTEQEESRRELKRYREYTDRLLNAIDDLFFALDEEAQFQRWNSRVPEVTGYSDEEIGEMEAFDLVPEEERERVAAEITEAFATGSGQVEVPLLRKDGTTVPHEFVGNLVEHPDGDLQVVGIGRDISEQKKRKQKLERQNDLFEKAQTLADVGAWEYDVRTDTVTWTDEVYRIHDRAPAGELTSEKVLSYYHPDDQPEIREALAQAVQDGTPYDLQLRLITEEGAEKWIRTRGEPQREEGEVVRVRGTIQDITEQKKREHSLRERQKKLEVLYEATNQLLQAEDEEDLSTRLSDLVDRTLDYPATTIRFARDETLVPVHVPSAVQDHMPERPSYDIDGETPAAEAYQSGETRAYEDLSAEMNTLDRGNIRATAYVPMGPYGLISVGSLKVGGIGTFDLRLLKVLASYAALVLDRLEREEALLAAKEEAEKANRVKSSFLANMSHEIRTPLTSIIGFAETAGTEASKLELPESNPLPKYTELIERGGKRLLDTLEGVLNLSKLEAGRMEIDEGPVSLATEAQQAAEELRPEAEEKQIDLRLQTEGVWAVADGGGVQIVLRNLLSNAIKYTEKGGCIWVRTYREKDAARSENAAQSENAAVLEVEDTGIGMEPEVAERLFEPFRQASEGFGREYEGTGVGLAVTKKAAEQMGGSIEVETEKGEGSRFIARLPEAEESASEGPDA